jgi:hypothetical protein
VCITDVLEVLHERRHLVVVATSGGIPALRAVLTQNNAHIHTQTAADTLAGVQTL